MIALSVSAGAAFAMPLSDERKREMATNVAATMIRFSPEGVRLWVDHVMVNGVDDRYVRSSQLMRSIGEQLAHDRPDRERLAALGIEEAQDAARLKQLDHDQLMDIAFRLSDEDRKILGRLMVRNAEEELTRRSSHLNMLP